MKIIPQPKLSFTTFLEPDQNETLTQEVYHISTDLLSLIGTLSCEDKTQIDNADYLKSYSADIYKINISKNTEELYESSGTINTET
jgi:proline dehydrogenase